MVILAFNVSVSAFWLQFFFSFNSSFSFIKALISILKNATNNELIKVVFVWIKIVQWFAFILLFQPSVREYQNSPVQQRPPKKTQPTRTQLLMEQIKASIAAEKNKPKKEIKSRLGPLLASPVVRKSAESRPSGI